MWPFKQIRQRRYERRYKAAMVVLLGTYMGDSLSSDERLLVESEMDANLNRSDMPAVAWRRLLGQSDLTGVYRAVAMEKAGIEPLVPALSWVELFAPWKNWRKVPGWPLAPGFDFLPTGLVYDFRPMDQATMDARAYLREHGFTIPDFDPWDHAPR